MPARSRATAPATSPADSPSQRRCPQPRSLCSRCESSARSSNGHHPDEMTEQAESTVVGEAVATRVSLWRHPPGRACLAGLDQIHKLKDSTTATVLIVIGFNLSSLRSCAHASAGPAGRFPCAARNYQSAAFFWVSSLARCPVAARSCRSRVRWCVEAEGGEPCLARVPRLHWCSLRRCTNVATGRAPRVR